MQDTAPRMVIPRTQDVGGLEVRRALPSTGCRMVGPFVFLDAFGPAEFLTGKGLDIRPHPHIGLSTVTYLLEGAIVHKDSLGTDLEITPGALNLMTAGKGIVHSERTGSALRATGSRLFGMQSWMALPKHLEEQDPTFQHVDATSLPVLIAKGFTARVIAGSFLGGRAPTRTATDTLNVDVSLEAGATLPLETEVEELSLFTLSGAVEIGGVTYPEGRLLIVRPQDKVSVHAPQGARLMLFGGETLDGPRHLWWNFVSSSKERIEAAREDWRQRRFDTIPGDAEDFIALP